MKKPGKENILIAGYISEFLDGYVLSQKTSSMNTLKSYQDAIVLYLSFLENEKKVRSDSLNADCFRHTVIEEWLVWLRESRGCSPDPAQEMPEKESGRPDTGSGKGTDGCP